MVMYFKVWQSYGKKDDQANFTEQNCHISAILWNLQIKTCYTT